MDLQIKVELVKSLPMKSGEKNGKKWQNIQLIFRTLGEYPKEICFKIFKSEIIDNLKHYKAGDIVDVKFNLESKEYNQNYYTDATIWFMKKSENTETQTTQTTEKQEVPKQDDLPF